MDGEHSYIWDGVDLRLVARRQRLVLWLVLGAVLSIVMPFTLQPILYAIAVPNVAYLLYVPVFLGIRIAVLIGAILLMRALKTNIVLLIVCTILMIVPFLNLLVLLMENRRATKHLRKAGLRVGFMGVRDEDVVRRLAANLCRTCAYDLTGNVSGICPECGTLVASPGSPSA